MSEISDKQATTSPEAYGGEAFAPYIANPLEARYTQSSGRTEGEKSPSTDLIIPPIDEKGWNGSSNSPDTAANIAQDASEGAQAGARAGAQAGAESADEAADRTGTMTPAVSVTQILGAAGQHASESLPTRELQKHLEKLGIKKVDMDAFEPGDLFRNNRVVLPARRD